MNKDVESQRYMRIHHNSRANQVRKNGVYLGARLRGLKERNEGVGGNKKLCRREWCESSMVKIERV